MFSKKKYFFCMDNKVLCLTGSQAQACLETAEGQAPAV